MTKIGKIKMFEGKYQLYQTDRIEKYIHSFTKKEKADYLIGKKPIMVNLHEEGLWVREDLFKISGGDVFFAK